MACLPVLVALPSSNRLHFSGFPLDSSWEVAAGVVAVSVMFRPTRTRARAMLGEVGPTAARWLAAAALLAVIARLILLALGGSDGFSACYRVPALPGTDAAVTATPAGQCERSFADPFRVSGATRTDRRIDFGSSVGLRPAVWLPGTNWYLDFLNSNRFNFNAADTEVPFRPVLPFGATWSGRIDNDRPRVLTARYVGEGSVAIGDSRWVLPPSPDVLARFVIDVPAGNHAVRVDYKYERVRLGGAALTEPYGEFRLRYDGGRSPFLAAGSGTGEKLAGWLADAVTAALIAFFATAALISLSWLTVPALAAAALAAVAMASGSQTFVAIGPLALLLIWAVGARLKGVSPARVALAVVVGAVAVEWIRTGQIDSWQRMLYRSGGDDFLTYKSQAQSLLSGSLRGEEDVFVYSPGFRYVLATGNLIFGAGDRGPLLATMAGFGSAMVLALVRMLVAPAAELVRRLRSGPSGEEKKPGSAFGWALAAMAAALATLVLSGSPRVFGLVQSPMSEAATWVLLPLVWILIRSEFRGRLLIAAVALATALVVRFDQAPGLAVLFGCLLASEFLPGRAEGRRRAIAATAVFIAIALLPAAHNLVYGGRFVVLPETPRIAVNFPLSPLDLGRAWGDEAVRATLGSQMKGVAMIGQDLGPGLSSAVLLASVRVLQATWLLAVGVALVRRRRISWLAHGLLAVPLAFLVAHVFLQVYVYYPRHVIMGYLAMGLSATLVLGRWASGGQAKVTNQSVPSNGEATVAPSGEPGGEISCQRLVDTDGFDPIGQGEAMLSRVDDQHAVQG